MDSWPWNPGPGLLGLDPFPGLLALDSWPWTLGPELLALDSWPCTPGPGLQTLDSRAWTPGHRAGPLGHSGDAIPPGEDRIDPFISPVFVQGCGLSRYLRDEVVDSSTLTLF